MDPVNQALETAAEASAAVEAAEASNEPKLSEQDRLEELCVNTIRFLAVDAVEKAKSGHPGTPMGMADIAFVLWTEFLHHDPKHPGWRNRDRFVLSNGHSSMLLYALLHLTGYEDMTLEELKNFRQWGSKTAGHPEYGHAAGIEVTTGPLGQGFANAVGMGLAARMLAARFNSEEFQPVDHYVYVFCSDGDLMEGISSEAASVAGHLGLGKMIYLYDDNQISIEGETRLAFSENVRKRFEASDWHVQSIDGHDRNAIRKAIRKAQKVMDRPSMIICRTIIGWGSPKMHGTAEVHGAPLGPEETIATKKALGWPLEPTFYIPEEVRAEFLRRTRKLARSRTAWEKRMGEWRLRDPQLAEEYERYWTHQLAENYLNELVSAGKSDKPQATRALSGQVIQKLATLAPFLVGGSADLAPSTLTLIKNGGSLERKQEDAPPRPSMEDFKGRNLHFGVREHSMGAIVNGMTLYGCWRAYGATFLIFSDYMRPAVRLAALMNIPSIFVYTHDSVFLGEDGPTHQPVEHYWALRAIPNLTLFRPADGTEVAMAWAWAVGKAQGPSLIALTRQKLDLLKRSDGFDPKMVWKGAYVLEGYSEGEITIIATGSEVSLAVKAADELKSRGVSARVVSAPCLELFDQQDREYQDQVLGKDRGSLVAIEAGRTSGWYRYVAHQGLTIGIDRFGASAPYEVIAENLGFTPRQVADRVLEWRQKQSG
jgi:transketolase